MAMDRAREGELELIEVFRTSATKHEANRRAKPILEQLSREPRFLTAVFEKYLRTPGLLDQKNYPVVGMTYSVNPHFGFVVNCWIPLPSGATHVSTKMIHHHGDMLLSTATLFGPGYEHWMFTLPKELPGGDPDLFSMELLEAAPHPKHHVSFVDAWTSHVPLFPRSLSITLALWSSRFPVTWRDRLKRLPVFAGREAQLRKLAMRLGLRKRLELKVVESFDYYPAPGGFRVMRERKEFERGPNEHHVASVFHVLQETGNEHLAANVRRAIDAGIVKTAKAEALRLLPLLERGTPIAGKLSAGHFDVPYANFTRDDIDRALRAVGSRTKGENDGSKLAAEAAREAALGAGPR
jgi:hypothetical protein